jgi:hypothetical protein
MTQYIKGEDITSMEDHTSWDQSMRKLAHHDEKELGSKRYEHNQKYSKMVPALPTVPTVPTVPTATSKGSRGTSGDRDKGTSGTNGSRGTSGDRDKGTDKGTDKGPDKGTDKGTNKEERDKGKLVDFWNNRLVDYVINELGVLKDQKVFKPFNQNAEQIVIDDMGFSVQSRKSLPEYIMKYGVAESFIENSLIYQVDTIYSLWHSILALIYPDYLFLDYERKRLSVMRFRDAVNNEFINNQKLRNDIQARKMRLVHVENAICQEKIQDEILLRFFAIYFDMNIYLVDEDSSDIHVYHNLQNFTGKPISGINTQVTLEIYNPYKASILLYRYRYGNIAPVFQEGRSSQILSSTTDPGFILPISSKFLGSTPNPSSFSEEQQESTGSAKQEVGSEASVFYLGSEPDKKLPVGPVGPVGSVQQEVVPDQSKGLKLVSRKQESEDAKSTKSKFIGTLLKLKWEELSNLAEKENINPLQPTTRGYDSWKKKTKNQIAEELWEATENAKN